MTDNTRVPDDPVSLYMLKLRKALAGLPAEDIEEILRELRGHIAERAAEVDFAQKGGAPVERILSKLGTPEYIGSLYRADTLAARARASFSPALIILTTLSWATKTILGFVAFIIGFAGYAIGLALVVLALLKPILPSHIGLWITRHGMQMGYQISRAHGTELLGWWIIPIDLVVGAAFLLGTTVFLRWMLRFVPRASRRLARRA